MTSSHKIVLGIAISAIALGVGFLGYDYALRNQSFRYLTLSERGAAETQLREADHLLRQNSVESAEEAAVIFNKVLSANVSEDINQISKYGLAVALEKSGDRETALDYLRQLKKEVVSDKSLVDKVDYSLGRLLLMIRHHEEGDSLLKTLLARTTDDRMKSKIHTAYGDYFLYRKHFKKARENYRVALKYYPENLQAELGHAKALRKEGKSVSWEYYDDYLLGNGYLEPQTSKKVKKSVHKDLVESGISASKKGNCNEAISLLRRAGSEDDRVLYWLGESYAACKQKKSALQSYQRVLENSSSGYDQPALIKGGILYFESSDYRQALKYFERAVVDYPDGAYTDKAREWLNEAENQVRDLDPSRSTDDYLDK